MQMILFIKLPLFFFTTYAIGLINVKKNGKSVLFVFLSTYCFICLLQCYINLPQCYIILPNALSPC